MDSLFTALGIVVAMLLAFIAGKGVEQRKKVEPAPTEGEQKKSNETVKQAEQDAQEQEGKANEQHKNASDDSVIKRFFDVFSKPPRDRK